MIAHIIGTNIHGSVAVEQLTIGIRFTGRITGLNPNSKHAMHVHEGTSCSGEHMEGACAHFNPTNQQHPYHAGDLPNLVTDASGTATFTFHTTNMSLEGPNSCAGRAIVIHANADDYKTDPSGNSGARIACGIIQ